MYLNRIIIPSALLGILALAYFILPPYHVNNLMRIMVLAGFAYAYNIAYGYCGLLSLGHALFFVCGMYGFGFAVLAEVPAILAVLIGVFIGVLAGVVVGILSLRRKEIKSSGHDASFMIITLMLAQAGYFSIIYFGNYTRADEGFSLSLALRQLDTLHAAVPYFIGWGMFACVLAMAVLLKYSKIGRIWEAIRENPTRTALSGYNVFDYRLLALVVSSALSALSGAVYVWLFGYVGASYAEVTYSILPLLWVLVGGIATILGPFIGTALMFYVIESLSSLTEAYLGIVGVLLVLLMLWGRGGIVSILQQRGLAWLK